MSHPRDVVRRAALAARAGVGVHVRTISNSDPRRTAMSDRRVTMVQRDEQGDLVALCNPEEGWSPVYRETVIRHLTTGLFDYFTAKADYITYVRIDEGPDGSRLLTTPDPNSPNNLENLPELEAAGAR